MGIGAVFGAMNTMAAIVAARTREIGTLRALGFSRLSILRLACDRVDAAGIGGGILGCSIAIPVNGMNLRAALTSRRLPLRFALRRRP